MPHPKREEHFPGFLTWLKGNGVNTDAVSIDKFEEGGFGLKATREIEVHRVVVFTLDMLLIVKSLCCIHMPIQWYFIE